MAARASSLSARVTHIIPSFLFQLFHREHRTRTKGEGRFALIFGRVTKILFFYIARARCFFPQIFAAAQSLNGTKKSRLCICGGARGRKKAHFATGLWCAYYACVNGPWISLFCQPYISFSSSPADALFLYFYFLSYHTPGCSTACYTDVRNSRRFRDMRLEKHTRIREGKGQIIGGVSTRS